MGLPRRAAGRHALLGWPLPSDVGLPADALGNRLDGQGLGALDGEPVSPRPHSLGEEAGAGRVHSGGQGQRALPAAAEVAAISELLGPDAVGDRIHGERLGALNGQTQSPAPHTLYQAKQGTAENGRGQRRR